MTPAASSVKQVEAWHVRAWSETILVGNPVDAEAVAPCGMVATRPQSP